MLPWTSTSSRVPARACSLSNVLRDHGVERPAPLERDERAVGPVGPLALEHREAVAVEAPEALRVRVEGVDVCDLHRIDSLPQAGPGCAEVGNP